MVVRLFWTSINYNGYISFGLGTDCGLVYYPSIYGTVARQLFTGTPYNFYYDYNFGGGITAEYTDLKNKGQ